MGEAVTRPGWAALALALLGCTFEAPPLDAPSQALGVCLWKRQGLDPLPPSPLGCWRQHAPAHATLTAFELADPCDAPAVGAASVLLEAGGQTDADVFAYYYTGPPLTARVFWAEAEVCE